MPLLSGWSPRAIYRLFFALLLIAGICGGASPSPLSEYDVKAAVLVNFARYVEWPASAFHYAADPLVICVLGTDPFGHVLDEIAAGKSVDGRALVIRRITDTKSTGICHILYAGSTERKLLDAVSSALPLTGVLSVGEAGKAGSDAMVLTFTKEDGKLHFTVNMQAADREQLRLSSRLLGLASRVSR